MADDAKDPLAGRTGIYEDPDFELFGDCEISKSFEASDGGEPSWIIEGHLLNRVKDSAGETPILEKMDWDHFLQKGVIKYEHDDKNEDGNPIPRPKRVIGVPHEVRQDGDHVYFKAALLKRMEWAKDTRDLILALQEHNKEHPEHKRTIGLSIEGGYLQKGRDGRYIGRVINAVVTPNPQDVTTWADIRDRHNLKLAKSLMGGHANTPDEQTGAAALRRESLRGGIVTWQMPTNEDDEKDKNKDKDKDKEGKDGKGEERDKKKKGQVNPSHKKKFKSEGGKVMESRKVELEFQSWDQAFGFFKSELGGLSDEDAKDRADEMFPDHEDETPGDAGDPAGEGDDLNKSIEEQDGKIDKLVKSINKFIGRFNPEQGDDDQPDDQGKWVDVSPLLKDVRDTLPALVKSMREVQKSNIKLHQDVEAMKGDQEEDVAKSEVEKLTDKVTELTEKVEKSEKLLEEIGSTEVGFSVTKLAEAKLANEGDGAPISKAEVSAKLVELSKEDPNVGRAITQFTLTNQLSKGMWNRLGYVAPPGNKGMPTERLAKSA